MLGKGYAALSIQDVLDDLDASKGAFYHYFGSKTDLLDAVVERLVDGALRQIEPIIADTGSTAIAKLDGVFAGIAAWKGERREFLLGLLEAWTSDENAVVRERFRGDLVRRLTPPFSTIVEQGRADGDFDVADPSASARVLVSLIQGANEAAVELWLAHQAGTVDLEHVAGRLEAYNDAIERVLGARPGTLHLLDRRTLRTWFAQVPHAIEVASA